MVTKTKEPQTGLQEMGLLRIAESTTAFFKVGLFGFPGTGKTYLATNMAIGLHKYLKSKKPIAFLDSETGSDFAIPRFKEANIPLFTAKTRAFSDLVSVLREAEKNCSILIIDSISHFWVEIQRAYMKEKHINRLYFQHWLPIKTEWREKFTDLFLNSKLHIISCARASWIYDFEEDEEGGKELVKQGAQMKVEAEFGYEPSLILQLERIRLKLANTKSEVASEFVYRCYVNKDRADRINGKYYDNAVFENFLPHIDFLNIGGKHLAIDTTRTSKALFEKEDDSGFARQKRKEIALEEIKIGMKDRWDTKTRLGDLCARRLLKEVFDSGNWKRIEELPVETLEKGVISIKNARSEDIEALVHEQIKKPEPEEKSKKKEVKD